MTTARLYILMLCTVFGSVACQTGYQVHSGNRLFHELSAGELVLHQDIVIPAGRSHVVFQSEGISQGTNEYHPHCELELRHVRQQPQPVQADVFRVTRVRGQTHYVMRPAAPVLLAAAGGFNWLASDSSEWIMLAYHMSLYSETQPDVVTLVCGGAYNYPYYARYPGLEEIRAALGKVATLGLP
jgi:hypothetical protein